MQFSANPQELIAIFGTLSDPEVAEEGNVTLTAKGCCITAEKKSVQTGTGAMVFEPGQSVISQHQLCKILKGLKGRYGKHARPENIYVEITARRLQFGSFITVVSTVEPDGLNEDQVKPAVEADNGHNQSLRNKEGKEGHNVRNRLAWLTLFLIAFFIPVAVTIQEGGGHSPVLVILLLLVTLVGGLYCWIGCKESD